MPIIAAKSAMANSNPGAVVVDGEGIDVEVPVVVGVFVSLAGPVVSMEVTDWVVGTVVITEVIGFVVAIVVIFTVVGGVVAGVFERMSGLTSWLSIVTC